MSVTDELTEKELRRLSRKELLALMLDMAKRTEELERGLELERERHLQELEHVKAAAVESSQRAYIRAEHRLERLAERLERGYTLPGRAGKNDGAVRSFFSGLSRTFFKKGKPN